MYAAVPRMTPRCVIAGLVIVGDCVRSGERPAGSSAFAKPKSSTFTVPSSLTFTLAGFRSRWMIPSSCAASSASAICFAMGRASSIPNRVGPHQLHGAGAPPPALRAQGCHALPRLRCPSASSVDSRLGCVLSGNDVGERRPFDQFEDQRLDAVRFLESVDRRDVRMIERREDLRFALEPRETFGVLREEIRQHLQRDVTIELRVAGAIDFAHARRRR